MSSPSEVTQIGREKERNPQEGKKREKSREALVDMNARLARVELAVVEGQERFEETDKRIEGLESEQAELREEMQGAVNQVVESCHNQGESMKDSLLAEIATLREDNKVLREELVSIVAQLKEIKGEMTLYKLALAQRGARDVVVQTPTPLRVDVPRPKMYSGSRNAKEIDNFFWSLEQYHKAIDIGEDAKKIDNATLYLEDTAMVWWRRRHGDIEKGLCTINTWNEFKKELKRQFYPENAENEARAKLRHLTQNESIREYVKEFSEILLEIPNYPNKETFFAFMDGLQN